LSAAPVGLIAPTISGSAQPGQSVSEAPGTWANSPTNVVDQWERCDATGANCSLIAGATGEQYALTSADIGDTIRIEETASNSSGSATELSSPTAVVESPPPPPVSVSAPSITGIAEPGGSLIESPGTWANSPTSVVDQWERCDATGANCSPIGGTTGQQYTLTGADVGDTIRIEETASNSTGSATEWSSPTAVVETPGNPGQPPPPPPTAASPSAAGPPPSAGAPASTATSSPPGASPAQIRSSLLKILASAGRASEVRRLLAHGTYAVSIKVPGAGTLVVSWGVRPAKRSSPSVVALGRVRAARAGTARIRIRLTPQGRRLLGRNGTLRLTVKVTFTRPGSQPMTMLTSVTLP
jgi:hypothetical protein